MIGYRSLHLRTSRPRGNMGFVLRITSKGDQNQRPLTRLLLYPRVAGGREIRAVTCNGAAVNGYTNEAVVIPNPLRGEDIRVDIQMEPGQ